MELKYFSKPGKAFSGDYCRVRFYLEAEKAEWAGFYLQDLLPNGVVMSPPGRLAFRPEAPSAARLKVEGWFRKADIAAELRQRIESLGGKNLQFSRQKISNWNQRSRKGFPLQKIGCFFIIPAWRNPKVPSRSIALKLIQGQAFGTGLHASTRLMLLALQRDSQSICGKEILDVGAGSGILGFACLHLSAAKVVAVEAEASACREMRDNLTANFRRSGNFKIYHGLFPMARGLKRRRFGRILANLTTPVLLHLIKEFRAWLVKDGILAMSGIYKDAAAESVCRRASKLGYKILEKRKRGAWWYIKALKP